MPLENSLNFQTKPNATEILQSPSIKQYYILKKALISGAAMLTFINSVLHCPQKTHINGLLLDKIVMVCSLLALSPHISDSQATLTNQSHRIP